MNEPVPPPPESQLAAALDDTRWHLFDVAWSLKHGIAEACELTALANRLRILADHLAGPPRR